MVSHGMNRASRGTLGCLGSVYHLLSIAFMCHMYSPRLQEYFQIFLAKNDATYSNNRYDRRTEDWRK
jgi:hypothetical protein